MADLKEETTVDNQDSNQVEETVETRKPVDPSLEGIQLYYEKNKKMINYVGGGLALVIAVFVYFKFYHIPQLEKEAANEIFWAENFFQKDSFNIALNGGIMVNSPDGPKQMKGFLQVADEYGMTKTANLANYYAGVCLMRTGKFEQAIESLSKYSGSDDIIAPIAIGAIGDCHMELNHVDDAIKYYMNAADKSHNDFTSPLYLRKAGFANEQKSNYKEALDAYERIQREFPQSTEGREIEKDIAKVKALGNL
ncbi:MAG: tetratricopeptide repeat protein [Bacteroidia bacterium]|nr:tetratricopeptide repeat protein [Bacteroidia bacterium]